MEALSSAVAVTAAAVAAVAAAAAVVVEAVAMAVAVAVAVWHARCEVRRGERNIPRHRRDPSRGPIKTRRASSPRGPASRDHETSHLHCRRDVAAIWQLARLAASRCVIAGRCRVLRLQRGHVGRSEAAHARSRNQTKSHKLHACVDFGFFYLQ